MCCFIFIIIIYKNFPKTQYYFFYTADYQIVKAINLWFTFYFGYKKMYFFLEIVFLKNGQISRI